MVDVDILIVGGGVIGLTLLRALEPLGYRVLLVDSAAPMANQTAHLDARSLALSPASIAILNGVGVWSELQAHAASINTVHVSAQGAFGQTRLNGTHAHALGAVVEMAHLRRILTPLNEDASFVAPATLTAFDPIHHRATVMTPAGERTIHARLIVGADGAESSLRQWCELRVEKKEYQQQAIVANIGLKRDHAQVAYERFTSNGLMALLPMTGLRAALVWVQSTTDAAMCMALSDADFLARVQREFGYRLGRFEQVGRRVAYPLRQVIMPTQVAGRIVFIGNAAHTLHPVAGQGFNLGLRDVATLVQCIAETGLNADTLQVYQQRRQADHTAITRFTDGLVSLFSSRIPGVACARQAGLWITDNCDGLKRLISRYASGYGGVVPDLVCGIPLTATPPHDPSTRV